MWEYMVRLPVWEEDGDLEEGDLPLSAPLVPDLHAWQVHWTVWVDDQIRWRGEQHVHEVEGARLLRDVRRELKSGYDATLTT